MNSALNEEQKKKVEDTAQKFAGILVLLLEQEFEKKSNKIINDNVI